MKKTILSVVTLAIITLASCKKRHLDEVGVLVPHTVIEDPTIPSIEINDILLHSETYGNPSDPIVIAIHGGPGGDYRSLLNFRDLSNDGMFVVFYDQIGSGLSQRVDKIKYSNVQVFIDELDAVIGHYRQNSSQKVILAGHSWGAILATAYVNQKPNKITGLILAEPGGFTWGQIEAYIGRSRKLKLFDEFTNDFVYLDQFITSSDHNILDYKMALSTAGDVTVGNLGTIPYWRYGAVCNSASIDFAINNPEQMNFTNNLGNYKTKVLFAYSELNSAYGTKHAELVSSKYTNVQLEQIKGTGHEISYQGWSNFYPLIKTYLIEIL